MSTNESMDKQDIEKFVQFLRKLYKQLRQTGFKIKTSTKFIDYFVHDILDFSILNQKSKNFTKINSVFNIKESVSEIVEMLRDKMSMKDIVLKESYHNFDKLLVKTDQKRL